MTMSPSSIPFLSIWGTFASSAAWPTGSRKSSFSFLGRSSRFLSAGPQFIGVDVSVERPALCTAEMNRPEREKWTDQAKNTLAHQFVDELMRSIFGKFLNNRAKGLKPFQFNIFNSRLLSLTY